MSETIKVGDLVIQVHSCCPTPKLGIPGRVDRIERDFLFCPRCPFRTTTVLAHIEGEVGKMWVPLSWLRRIPPLSKLEESERKEKVKV